jgi:alkylhydroperoxidase family enzyme
VTLVADGHVPDAVYETVRPLFTDTDLINLTIAVATINAWNRLSIGLRVVPGSYQPRTIHEAWDAVAAG